MLSQGFTMQMAKNRRGNITKDIVARVLSVIQHWKDVEMTSQMPLVRMLIAAQRTADGRSRRPIAMADLASSMVAGLTVQGIVNKSA